MLKFTVKRLLHALLICWGVSSLIFVLIHLAPGDPTSLFIRPGISPEIVAEIRRQLGLELPLWQQYFQWMPQFLSGNFGVSFVHHRAVSELLMEAIPNTLQLTAVVFVLQFLLGVPLGILMAVKHPGKLSHALNSFLLMVYSLPGFWLALMGVLLFSVKLGWLPSSHMQSITAVDGFWADFADRLIHLVLPAAVLILPFTAQTARYVQSSLIEIFKKEYIRCAVAFGLSPSKVLWKYAVKNALLPQATLIGLYLPFLLGGAVITEYIFAWPGMGRLAINAIFTHDFPVILACTMTSAIAVVIGNLLSDLLYAFLDPRIKLTA